MYFIMIEFHISTERRLDPVKSLIILFDIVVLQLAIRVSALICCVGHLQWNGGGWGVLIIFCISFIPPLPFCLLLKEFAHLVPTSELFG